MHDGCAGSFTSGKQVINKIRMVGFAQGALPAPFDMDCLNCGKEMSMDTYEFACPHCKAVHGVTPCHAFSPDNVQCAGPDETE